MPPLYPNDKPASTAENLSNFSADGNRSMPDGARQTAGFLAEGKLPAQQFNALLRSNSQWITFLDTMVEKFDTTAKSVSLGEDSTSGNTAGLQLVALGSSAAKNTIGSNIIAMGVEAGMQTAISASTGESVIIGYQAGKDGDNGAVTYVGHTAGKGATSSFGSVAMGYISAVNAIGNQRTSIGYSSGANAVGQGALAVGSQAGENADGNYSVSIGFAAGFRAAYAADASSLNGVAIGTDAARETIFSEAVAIGNIAGKGATSIANGVLIGSGTAEGATFAIDSVIIGNHAGRINGASRSTSVHIGTLSGDNAALAVNTIGNTSVGYKSLYNAAGADNTCLGISAGEDSISAQNVIIGRLAGKGLINGIAGTGRNTIIGTGSGQGSQGLDSVHIGVNSGASITVAQSIHNGNVNIGNSAGYDVTVAGITTPLGVSNGQVFIGENAMLGVTAQCTSSGDPLLDNNVVLGVDAGTTLSCIMATGASISRNVVVGRLALSGITSVLTLEDNVAIGHRALESSVGDGTLSNNIAIGPYAGSFMTGTDNTTVGYHSGETGIGSSIVAIGRNTFNNSNVGDGSIFIGQDQGLNMSTTTDNVLRIGHIATVPFIEGKMLPTAGSAPLSGDLWFYSPITLPGQITAQIDADTTHDAGTLMYDSSLDKLRFFNGTSWETITSV